MVQVEGDSPDSFASQQYNIERKGNALVLPPIDDHRKIINEFTRNLKLHESLELA